MNRNTAMRLGPISIAVAFYSWFYIAGKFPGMSGRDYLDVGLPALVAVAATICYRVFRDRRMTDPVGPSRILILRRVANILRANTYVFWAWVALAAWEIFVRRGERFDVYGSILAVTWFWIVLTAAELVALFLGEW